MKNSVLAKSETGEVQLTITIPRKTVEEAYHKVLEKTANEAALPGFRKGKAPKNLVEENIDKSKLYEQVLQDIVPQAYLDALQEHNIQPLVSPKVELINAKEGEDWQIRATTAERPEVVLGEYKAKLKSELAPAKLWTPDKKQKQDQPETPPNQDEKIQNVINALPKVIKVQIPHILVDDEVGRALANLINKTEKLGITLDQYLASTGKTIENLKAEYHERVENDLQVQFILDKIAQEENIEIKEEEILGLINASGDEKMQQELNTPENRMYLRMVLARRKVLDFLANL